MRPAANYKWFSCIQKSGIWLIFWPFFLTVRQHRKMTSNIGNVAIENFFRSGRRTFIEFCLTTPSPKPDTPCVRCKSKITKDFTSRSCCRPCDQILKKKLKEHEKKCYRQIFGKFSTRCEEPLSTNEMTAQTEYPTFSQ